jgi:hypothetical protein
MKLAFSPCGLKGTEVFENKVLRRMGEYLILERESKGSMKKFA